MRYLCTLYARVTQVIDLGWKGDRKRDLGDKPFPPDFHNNHEEPTDQNGIYLSTMIEVARQVADNEQSVETWKNPQGIVAGCASSAQTGE